MKIKLEELAAAMAQSDVRQSYVDIAKGKVMVVADDMDEEQALEHVFTIEEDWEHYIPVPNVIDEDLRGFMQGFAASREREDVKERLQDALQGSGAVTRFNHQVRHLLLKPVWEKYLQAQLIETARDWCEENALEYEE
ncbi:hypothetical protein FZ041_09360 [Selenomonas caprae]|uniref:Uncharacterized protein n=1 Tax=Selenomonas caprae TaxID=2606905 RepID=A0A5D6WP54_9FIRM|nr:UPF0158 family protein [Selenomonas caprae]TYZ28134.1 hypothetical protein FZ041_09360 [Selenomonas caprae]